MKKKILYGISGSFCNFNKILQPLKKLCEEYDVTVVVSDNVSKMDTRFFKAVDYLQLIEQITKNKIIDNLVDAEKVGPYGKYELMIIAPMTSTCCAKLVHGIYDHNVTLAAKAMLRNNKTLLFGIACNDGLGISGENIMKLINMKNIYVIPFSQDDPIKKEKSIVSHFELMNECVKSAFNKQQLQPIIRQK